MEIRTVPIEQVHFAPYNPRFMEDAEFEKLKQSIVTFGYIDPIIWNPETGNTIGGNQRLKAAIELGFKEIQVVVLKLPLTKEKALNIALNKISGKFDLEKLTPLLEELSKMPDFEFELTGFELPELSQLLDRYEETKEDDFDFEATVDSIEEPVTKKGDLILLGNHRLLCGDSADPADFKRLMGDDKAQMLFTDPPFNVRYQNNRPTRNLKRRKYPKWQKIYKDDLPQEEYEKWLEKVFSNVDEYLVPCSPLYCFNGHRQFGPMYLMLLKLGYRIGSVIVWAKPNFAISYGDYNQQIEFCLYGWKPGEGGHFWYGPNNETTLWESRRDAGKTLIHPTQKPISLAQRAIKNSSQRGDIIIETFCGSGSTLIAAESLERRCFAVEISEAYCDAIVRRYVSFVGKDKVSDELRKKYLQEN